MAVAFASWRRCLRPTQSCESKQKIHSHPLTCNLTEGWAIFLEKVKPIYLYTGCSFFFSGLQQMEDWAFVLVPPKGFAIRRKERGPFGQLWQKLPFQQLTPAKGPQKRSAEAPSAVPPDSLPHDSLLFFMVVGKHVAYFCFLWFSGSNPTT